MRMNVRRILLAWMLGVVVVGPTVAAENPSAKPVIGSASPQAVTGRPLSVLFVGNSYTFYNDLPRMVRQMSLDAAQPRPLAVRDVTFGGASLEEIGLERVREHVAVVLQHPALFNDTVRANLSMGRAVTDDECWRALGIAQLADTVRGLPQGLDSVVGRSGVRLSGGQRQRLAIARMILAKPKVVILDEATSALDAATEYALHQALGEFLQGRTTLIIAHRLSAVKQADRVLVFDGGHIAEQGGHQQLIAEGGLYAKLYGHLQH